MPKKSCPRRLCWKQPAWESPTSYLFMFGILWQCLFAFEAHATVLLDSDAIWGEKRSRNTFNTFQKKSHSSSSSSTRGETWESLAFFFCSASDPVWSPPITLTLLNYIFNDNLNRGVTFFTISFSFFFWGGKRAWDRAWERNARSMRVVSTSVKRDRMCEMAGRLRMYV